MVSTKRLVALSGAYKQCQLLANQHPENFPVASWLLPRALRPHVAAIYTFARTADDFADEPGREAAERFALLDEWGRRLRGTELGVEARGSDPEPVPIFVALAHTRREFGLPIGLFEDLLSAFRQDVVKTRYDSWDEVFDYCRRSANPVGRLVLRLFGYDSPELDRYSDAVCTALQLTNFWQAALTQATARTRQLFHEGRPIADRVRGRLRYELRATWLGGMRILDRIERVNFDVVHRRPALRLGDGLVIAWRAARW